MSSSELLHQVSVLENLKVWRSFVHPFCLVLIKVYCQRQICEFSVMGQQSYPFCFGRILRHIIRLKIAALPDQPILGNPSDLVTVQTSGSCEDVSGAARLMHCGEGPFMQPSTYTKAKPKRENGRDAATPPFN